MRKTHKKNKKITKTRIVNNDKKNKKIIKF